MVWYKVIIVSAVSLSLRDKVRLRDRESLTTIAIEYTNTSISRFRIEGTVIIGRLSHRS